MAGSGFMKRQEKEMKKLRQESDQYVSGWVNDPEVRRKRTKTDLGILSLVKEAQSKKRP